MDWKDGMILNVTMAPSSSEEELVEISSEEEDARKRRRKGVEPVAEKRLKKSEEDVRMESGDEERVLNDDEIKNESSGGKKGAKGGRKCVPGMEDKDDDIKDAIKALMNADSNYVGDGWQSGAKKVDSKNKVEKKIEGASPEMGMFERRGLEGWEIASMAEDSEGFTEMGVDAAIAANLIETGFTLPRKVQKSMIPAFLSGRDLLVGSGPGTGKGLGYIIPLVHCLQSQEPRISRGEGTFAVILCASKEACLAVCDVLKKLMSKFCWWLTCSHFLGGENRNHEKARLRKGVTVMVATDTRLLDHLENTAAFRTQDLRWFIVDEAAQHLQSKRGNRIRRAVRMLEDRVRDSSGMEGRQQNILITSSMDPELGSLAVWMLKRPLCTGLKPRLGKRFWDVVSMDGWQIKPFVSAPDIQGNNVYSQRYHKKGTQED